MDGTMQSRLRSEAIPGGERVHEGVVASFRISVMRSEEEQRGQPLLHIVSSLELAVPVQQRIARRGLRRTGAQPAGKTGNSFRYKNTVTPSRVPPTHSSMSTAMSDSSARSAEIAHRATGMLLPVNREPSSRMLTR